MSFTTTSDRAASIRRHLKANGMNARAVSVRVSGYSMGSTIHVTVRKFGISHTRVKMLVQGFERVDRCEVSGDILCGGNTFVHVAYAHKLMDEAKSILRHTVQDAYETITSDQGRVVEVVDGMALVFFDGEDLRLTTPGGDDGFRRIWNSPDALLCGIAGHVLSQGWEPSETA